MDGFTELQKAGAVLRKKELNQKDPQL